MQTTDERIEKLKEDELPPPDQIKRGEIIPWDTFFDLYYSCEKQKYAEKWQTINTSAK